MLFNITTGQPVLPLMILAHRHSIEQSSGLLADALSERLNERWRRETTHQYQISGEPPILEDTTVFAELGLLQWVDAPAGKYDGALLLGSTVVAARKRLSCLVQQHEKGVALQQVFLLGSYRPLDPVKESPEVLCAPAELPFKPDWTAPNPLPTTEAGMMDLVFAQSQLPAEWKSQLVDTPDQPVGEGKTRPANTVDTLKMALDKSLTPGRYILVSSQPYVRRQALNARRILGPEFEIVPVGYGAPALSLPSFLDEVRNLLAEELLSVKKANGYAWSPHQ